MLDQGYNVGCIYVDIKNAFPSVDHTILVQRLNDFNNLGLSNQWFASYLSDRCLYTDVCNAYSNTRPITRGVPQGSLFGPLLFNVYYNDVAKAFCPNEITLYADDTAVVATGTSIPTLLEQLRLRLQNVNAHLMSLRMDLNTQKTVFMLFKSSCSDNALCLQNQPVKQCSTFKYLGVYIDSNLGWHTHVSRLIAKVHKMLYVMHRCKGRSNVDLLPMLFRAYIYPHFLYGMQLYMFCSVAMRAKLESLFRRCCRMALCDSGQYPLLSNLSVYVLLDVLPLRHLFQHTSAIMLYKILILEQIPALSTLFNPIQHTSRNARIVPASVVVLRLPSISSEGSRHNFAYWGAKLWNMIPATIRCSDSLSRFSTLYHQYLSAHLSDYVCDHYDILDFV
jgi:hypothetical protein